MVCSGSPRNKAKEHDAAVVFHLKLKDNPKYPVREAMMFVGFSRTDAINRTMQQRVRRIQDSLVYLHPSKLLGVEIETTSTSDETLSPISGSSDDESRSSSELSRLSRKRFSPRKKAGHVKCKTTYRTSNQVQADRNNRAELKEFVNAAKKRATRLYNEGKHNKHLAPLSSEAVSEQIQGELGVRIPARTIRELVQNGHVGFTLPRPGNPGRLNLPAYKALCAAVGSFIEISQVNGEKEVQMTKLIRIVNLVVNGHPDERGIERTGPELIRRILDEPELACVMNCDTEKQQEARRNVWCSYFNVKDWIDCFKEYLIRKGFAVDVAQFDDVVEELILNADKYDNDAYDEEEVKKMGLIFLAGKKKDLGNIDESGVAPNEKGAQGGRGSVVFFNTKYSRAGSSMVKSDQTGTLVMGANGANEPFPPHLQFCSAAKSDERQTLEESAIPPAAYVYGKWGLDEAKDMACTFGLNEKGGMDANHFAKMILNLMPNLYPNARPEFGKWVCLLTDMGPGRENEDLAARLRLMGIDLYPLLPNATHIMQLMDQLFSYFKHVFRKNVETVATYNITQNHGKDVAISRPMLARLVYGGPVNPDDDNSPILSNCIEESFTPDKIKKGWDKIGMIPWTTKLLESPDVRHEITTRDGEVDETLDPQALELKNLEERNHMACAILTSFGYKGKLLKIAVKRKTIEAHEKRRFPIGSLERQQALASAHTAGKRNMATGGDHLTSDDAFKGREIKRNAAEIDILLEKKKVWGKYQTFVQDLDKVKSKVEANQQRLTIFDLKVLITSKEGGAFKNMKKREELAIEWERVKDAENKVGADEWTEADEADLTRRQSENIDIKDTAVGRAMQREHHQLMGAITHGMLEDKSEQTLKEIIAGCTKQLDKLELENEASERD
jgi:hypothetical protein